MKSTYNWCFVLLNNIYYSRAQNSHQKCVREKALNRFQGEEEVSLPRCIVFIEEIMKDRLLNFRNYRESTVFGIPRVDIYFFQKIKVLVHFVKNLKKEDIFQKFQ